MRSALRWLTATLLILVGLGTPARADDKDAPIRIQEEIWALPLPLFAYLVRLSRRMHDAFTAAGGKAEYHLLPPFGNERHFFIGSPDAISIWSPLVTKFLDAPR